MDGGDVPALISDSDPDSDHEGWEDGDNEDEDEQMSLLSGSVKCLFCNRVESSVLAVIAHCKEDHCFDLLALCKRWSVDCINYIKMINFCRCEHPSPAKLIQGMMSGGKEWQGDDFMQPVDATDLMLQLDIESLVESLPVHCDKENTEASAVMPDNLQQQSLTYQDPAQMSEAVVALAARARVAEEQRDLLRDELDRVLKDMERLKLSGQQLMMKAAGSGKENHDHHKVLHENDLNDEDGYFASYSHHGIHMTMLKDEVRTTSYRDFMLRNRHLFEGKAVLDVGCGTGILSMFAVQAGAGQVVAVDSSQIIYQAMDIARENNMHEKILFKKGRLEDVALPVEKFDVIISEWMGYFLLFEAMLDSVLWARDRYLAPGGCVYPDLFTMKVVGVNHPALSRQTVAFWDNVYGFHMSCMKRPVQQEVQVCTVPADTVVTEPAVIKEIDVQTCKVTDLDFHTDFSLWCQKDTELTALVGYFDTSFSHNCQHKIDFSTGPQSVKTHWEQAVMLLPKPLPVTQGSSLPCSITYKKHPQDSRGVIIHLTVGHLKLKYSLS